MQNQLEAFGLQKPTSEIALFIQDSPAFKSHLQSDLYPVAIPADETAIYKTYRCVPLIPNPSSFSSNPYTQALSTT